MYLDKAQLAAMLGDLKLRKLTEQQVEQIDELLDSLEDQGEVRLIMQRGMLKYINKVEKLKAWEDDHQQ